MKTKLLRKLRKEFSERYYISRYRAGWGVWTPWADIPYITSTLQEAKHKVMYYIHDDIGNYIRNKRRKKRGRHSFNYYPW